METTGNGYSRAWRLFGAVLLFAVIAGCAGHGRSGPAAPLQPRVLIELPQTRQATDYTCGVAVVQSLLAHGGVLFRQDILEKELGATPEDGTGPDAIMECLRRHGFHAAMEQEMTLERLRCHLDAGRPVVCLLQAWNGDPAFDYSDSWEDGHYAVAIGYDDCRVYFMDPSTLANYAYIDNKTLLTRWHDGDGTVQIRRAGIVVAIPSPVYRRNAYKPML
ncbi:MAG: C39 family peptidase [Planctomycetaceae bacterium]|nr:C39 family peptidase [Planctomycetaceae bacterium]